MRQGIRLNRFALFVSFVVVFVASAAWTNHAQQPGAPAAPANEDATFTGHAFRVDSKGFALSRRGFDPGARSDWHTHGGAQLLFVQEGRLRYQVQGGKMKEVALHESVYLPGGVAHWHGAVPGQPLTHVSVTFPDTTGIGLKWGDKVNDAQYSGKGK
jgi:quercetin dioxygenase-like cupin family protein